MNHFLRTFLVLIFVAHSSSNACTVFASPFTGDTQYAHNVDWYDSFPNVKGVLVMNPANLEKRGELYGAPLKAAQWVSKYRSLTFSIAGAEFPVSGFNEKGLRVAILELAESVYPRDDDPRPALGLSQFIQYNLDRSRTIDEVVASSLVIRPYSTLIRMHYFVCESSGECAVIQFINGDMKVYRGHDLPYPVLTNSLYPESAATAENCIKNVAGCVAKDNSLFRFANAAKQRLLMSSASNFETEGLAILEDVAQLGGGNVTRFQMIFDAAAQTVKIRKRGSKLAELKVNFDEADCRRPRMIIPIDEKSQGDLSGEWMTLTEAYQTDMAMKMGYPAKIAEIYGRYPFTVKCLEPQSNPLATQRLDATAVEGSMVRCANSLTVP